jgi:hypothetical protein
MAYIQKNNPFINGGSPFKQDGGKWGQRSPGTGWSQKEKLKDPAGHSKAVSEGVKEGLPLVASALPIPGIGAAKVISKIPGIGGVVRKVPKIFNWAKSKVNKLFSKSKALPDADLKYANSLGIDVNDSDQLLKLYNQKNTLYRSVDITPNMLSNPQMLDRARKAGVNVNNKEDLIKYISTSVPEEAIGNNIFRQGDNTLSSLYTSPDKTFASQYGMNQGNKVSKNTSAYLAEFPMFTDDVSKLSNTEILNRIKYRHRTKAVQNPSKAGDFGIMQDNLIKKNLDDVYGPNSVGNNTVPISANRITGKPVVDPSKVKVTEYMTNKDFIGL